MDVSMPSMRLRTAFMSPRTSASESAILCMVSLSGTVSMRRSSDSSRPDMFSCSVRTASYSSLVTKRRDRW